MGIPFPRLPPGWVPQDRERVARWGPCFRITARPLGAVLVTRPLTAS